VILADTSIWIDHLRSGDEDLARELENTRILTHPFIVGELALANMARRGEILTLLQNLRRAEVATHAEVLHLIEKKLLPGRGIGFVDAHLIASVLLSGAVKLWTRDKRLHTLAGDMGLACPMP
jgi:predicted nucleic acid-binding protein